MQSKEELKKQVVILAIILVLVIIVAIILNINKKEININDYSQEQNQNIENSTTNDLSMEEILSNLKGLIEEPAEEETLDTSGAENISTSSGESVQYLETEMEE